MKRLLLLLIFLPFAYAYTDYEMNLEGDNLDCEVKTNGTIQEFNILNKDKLRGQYVNKFNLNCNSTISNLEIFVYDNLTNKIYFNKLQNLTTFNYDNVKSKGKLYNVSIYVRDSFPENNKCLLVLDTTKKNYYFDAQTNLKDKFMGGVFGDSLSLSCSFPLFHFTLLIDDRQVNYEVFTKSYTNFSEIKLDMATIQLKSKPLPVRITKPKIVKPAVSPSVEIDDTQINFFVRLYLTFLGDFQNKGRD